MQLVADAITVRYGDREVLHEFSHLFRTGESVAITGPSGSGKTTLLSVLGGSLKPSSGKIGVQRDGVSEFAQPERHVAWVHQASNSLRDRTAIDNVVVGFLARGLAHGAAFGLAEELLNDVGLADRAAATASTLSGGELQRVAVARALAAGSAFVLADEPTGNLDRKTTVEISELLVSQPVARGHGVVVATHDELVAERCRHVIRLDRA
ncbi:MAG: ATP-binding cassette domain-containing protein [Actinomycetota bacterium]